MLKSPNFIAKIPKKGGYNDHEYIPKKGVQISGKAGWVDPTWDKVLNSTIGFYEGFLKSPCMCYTVFNHKSTIVWHSSVPACFSILTGKDWHTSTQNCQQTWTEADAGKGKSHIHRMLNHLMFQFS